MISIRYFAFGSNMLTEWLCSRCPSARACGVASAAGYALAFSKRSKDHSGKAMLVVSTDPAARVYGVLYDIDGDEMAALDRSEGRGRGYERVEDFEVRTEPRGKAIRVTSYMPDAASVDPALKSYDWYLALVVKGAEQHGLPSEYIAALRTVQSVPDPDPDNPTKKKAIAILTHLENRA